MELYIGGRAQGKTEYVTKQYPNAFVYDESSYEDMFTECRSSKAMGVLLWNHFHLSMKRLLASGISPEELWKDICALEEASEQLIIISDEIGSGIVPMEKEERIYREETGRMLCRIAKQATRVTRIFCGIPCILK